MAAIRQAVEQALSPSYLGIFDDSAAHQGHPGALAAGGAGHYAVCVVASQFTNRTLLQRHRLVYQAVAALFPQMIHALQIQAYTPEEWERISHPTGS